jgi:hypothetical protein
MEKPFARENWKICTIFFSDLIAEKRPTLKTWALQRSTLDFVFVASLACTTSGQALDWPAFAPALARRRLRLMELQA